MIPNCTKIYAGNAKVRKVVKTDPHYGFQYYVYPMPDYPSPFFIPAVFYGGEKGGQGGSWNTAGGSQLAFFLSGVPAGTAFKLGCTTTDCEGEGGGHGNNYGWIPANTGMSLSQQNEHIYRELRFTANTTFTGWVMYGDGWEFTLTSISSNILPYIKGFWSIQERRSGECGTSLGIDWNSITGLSNCDVQFYCFGGGSSVLDPGIEYNEILSHFPSIKYFIPLYSACYNKYYDLSSLTGMTTETFYYTTRDAHNISIKRPSGVGYDGSLVSENNITLIT